MAARWRFGATSAVRGRAPARRGTRSRPSVLTKSLGRAEVSDDTKRASDSCALLGCLVPPTSPPRSGHTHPRHARPPSPSRACARRTSRSSSASPRHPPRRRARDRPPRASSPCLLVELALRPSSSAAQRPRSGRRREVTLARPRARRLGSSSGWRARAATSAASSPCSIRPSVPTAAAASSPGSNSRHSPRFEGRRVRRRRASSDASRPAGGARDRRVPRLVPISFAAPPPPSPPPRSGSIEPGARARSPPASPSCSSSSTCASWRSSCSSPGARGGAGGRGWRWRTISPTTWTRRRTRARSRGESDGDGASHPSPSSLSLSSFSSSSERGTTALGRAEEKSFPTTIPVALSSRPHPAAVDHRRRRRRPVRPATRLVHPGSSKDLTRRGVHETDR